MTKPGSPEGEFYWVIGGGLLQLPLIAEIRKLGYRTIVTDSSSSCASHKEADIFLPVDIFDIPGHIKAAENLIAKGHRIAAVLAAGIDAPETMSALATHLGLPSVAPDIAHVVNNKDKFRAQMQKLGYPVPKFQVVDAKNIHQLPTFIDQIGYPLIVKNTDSSGSRGTKIFYAPDLDGITEVVNVAMGVSRSKRALLEECWEGPEQTVETIFDVRGHFHPCFITDRGFDRSTGYVLETGLRHPSTLLESTQAEMYALAEKVARDIGIKIGAAKYDMMLTKNGPRIIEMTVRLSGGFDCQYLVPAATGKNVLQAAILTALAQEFDPAILEDTKHRVGLCESIWPKPGRIVSIKGVEEAKAVPGLERIFFRYKVGNMIDPYVDCTKRVCFIIVTGETESHARDTLATVKNLIQIETVDA